MDVWLRLYEGSDGPRLSLAHDLNPFLTDIKPRILTTAIEVPGIIPLPNPLM
jgi:hypothetical protein